MQKYVPNAAQAALHAIRGQNRVHTFVGGSGTGSTTALLMDPMVNGFTSRPGHGVYLCSGHSLAKMAMDRVAEEAYITGAVVSRAKMTVTWPSGFESRFVGFKDDALDAARALQSVSLDHVAVDGIELAGGEALHMLRMAVFRRGGRMVSASYG